MKKVIIIFVIGALILLAGSLLWPGGGQQSMSDTPPGAGQMPQAMPVQVKIIEPEKLQIWKKFSGHLIAVDRADIRPQISGRITQILFEDGQHVEKDDVLFIIDPRPYEAALAQAKAALDAARAQSALAEKDYKRASELIKTEAVSQRVLDERTNNRKLAAAAVQGALATVESAKLNLEYAHVKAPITGKISRAEITEGNLVQAGPNAPLLTSIVADENIYADFEVDDQTYINSVRGMKDGENNKTPVKLSLPGDDKLYAGTVESFDNQINPATGTIRARALFENKDGKLLSGMSVTIQMGSAVPEEKILLTERAIGTDQDRKFVYIVNEQKMSEYREVKIGESTNGRRVILSGLKSGETVITEGIVRIRPGMPVAPQVTVAQPETPAKAPKEPKK